MDLLTTKDIARIYGISKRRAQQLAKVRGIGTQLPDRTYVFTQKEAQKFSERINGRPKMNGGKK
jgi:hypothetical protein